MPSIPQSVEAARRAFVPGQAAPLTEVVEWLNLPKLAILAALVYAVNHLRKPSSQRVTEAPTVCDEKYCAPTFITHVDRPLNTLLKDQSMGAGLKVGPPNPTLQMPYAKTKSDYYREAVMSPGVRLVAHAVA